jgi:hypothetical protein
MATSRCSVSIPETRNEPARLGNCLFRRGALKAACQYRSPALLALPIHSELTCIGHIPAWSSRARGTRACRSSHLDCFVAALLQMNTRNHCEGALATAAIHGSNRSAGSPRRFAPVNEHAFGHHEPGSPGVVIQLDGHAAERLAMTPRVYCIITERLGVRSSSRNDKPQNSVSADHDQV